MPTMTEASKVGRYGPVVCRFNSTSQPDKIYDVRFKGQGVSNPDTYSCNCKGFVFNKDKPKRCRHVDEFLAQQGEAVEEEGFYQPATAKPKPQMITDDPYEIMRMQYAAQRIAERCGWSMAKGSHRFKKFVRALLEEFGDKMSVATTTPESNGGGTLVAQPIRLITLED